MKTPLTWRAIHNDEHEYDCSPHRTTRNHAYSQQLSVGNKDTL